MSSTYPISLQRLLAGLASAYAPERTRAREAADGTLLVLFASIPPSQWVEAS